MKSKEELVEEYLNNQFGEHKDNSNFANEAKRDYLEGFKEALNQVYQLCEESSSVESAMDKIIELFTKELKD